MGEIKIIITWREATEAPYVPLNDDSVPPSGDFLAAFRFGVRRSVNVGSVVHSLVRSSLHFTEIL